ncbi:MAG: YceH family protein [Burkholderiaceae bacterium]
MKLDQIELRVLGSLLEKCLATPDQYPLSLNSLTLACNQKTSREPVTDYSESTVEQALEELREKKLVVQHVGGRAKKYAQSLSLMADITPQQLAVLAVLMLRGPQTPGELRQRAERMAPFAELADAQAALDALTTRQPPLAAPLAKRPGEKEVRYTQLYNTEFAGFGGSAPATATSVESDMPKSATQQRLDALEAELADLKAEFAAFRKQFE